MNDILTFISLVLKNIYIYIFAIKHLKSWLNWIINSASDYLNFLQIGESSLTILIMIITLYFILSLCSYNLKIIRLPHYPIFTLLHLLSLYYLLNLNLGLWEWGFILCYPLYSCLNELYQVVSLWKSFLSVLVAWWLYAWMGD